MVREPTGAPVSGRGPGYTCRLLRKWWSVTSLFRFFLSFSLVAALISAPAAVAAAQPAPVFVLNSLDGNVSVIDPTTWKEVKRIPTGKEPHHLYMTPDEKSVIVANALSDSLTFIDPRTAEVQRTVRDIIDPYHLRFSPDMKWFVTAANRLNHVDIYRWDGKDMQLAKRIPTGKTHGLVVRTRDKKMYEISMKNQDMVYETLDAVQRAMPHVVVGYTARLEQIYNTRLEDFVRLPYDEALRAELFGTQAAAEPYDS